MASAFPQDENIGILEIPDKRREFEELVAARGREFRRKVEEKREMEVQLIKLRQYLIPDSEPLPPGAFTLLQNNQIWDITLKYLSHSFDIDSAQRTCPTFEGILLGKTPTANPEEREVSAVLKIMKEDKYLKSSDSSLRKHVPWHLRLVSKSWQRATDETFLKEFEGNWHLELQLDWLIQREGRWWKHEVNVTKLGNLDLAWSILGNSNSRASLLKIIRLDENHLAEIGILHPRILEFLNEYGEHIEGLIVEWNEKTISWATKYLNLLSLVLRMPNLKALTIDGNLHRYPRSHKEDMDSLKDSILRHPFPQYSSIEVLCAKGCYYPLEPIVAEIISKCNKLKSVFLREAVWENELTRALEGRSIQYLHKPVSLPLLPIHTHADIVFLRKEMIPWASQLPLRKIVLDEYDFETSLERLSYVNHFGNTLEYLQLPIDSKYIGKPLGLQLPKLKHLYLRAWPGLTNLDFLIPLQSLEHLEFTYNAYYEKRKNSEDKFHLIELKDFGALEKSNIWRCFPHLRILKFDVYQELDLDLEDDLDDGEVYYEVYSTGNGDYRYRDQWSYEYFKSGQDIKKKLKYGILEETSCGYNFRVYSTSQEISQVSD